MSLQETLDKLLPQTQCEECGFKGCQPYANALAKGEAEINLCPPGGVEVLEALAHTLGKDPTPFRDEVLQNTRSPSLAKINEDECIGCTKCIQACPVDAILGTNKKMHSVIDFECTGCGLCVEPCPVDCIEMVEQKALLFNKDVARERFSNRQQRLEKKSNQMKKTYQSLSQEKENQNSTESKKAYILKALERAQKK